MATPQPNSAANEDLDSRVEALLNDIHVACDRVESATDDGPGATPVGPTDDTADLDHQIDSLLRSAEPAERAHSGSPESGPSVAPPSDPVSASGHDIGTLDANLARLTETLLKTNAPLPLTGPDPIAPSARGADPEGPAGVGESEDLVSAPTVKEPVRAPVPATPPPVAPAPTDAPEGPGLASRLAGSIGPGVARIGNSVGRATAPAVFTALAAASAPLSGRPKVVRDTVGWLALWTAFVSVSLWTYLLFFHKPEAPTTSGDPIQFVGENGKASGAPSHAQGADHAEAHDSTSEGADHGASAAGGH